MRSVDAVVVGGGIAGLSAAYALGRDRRVVLVEREPVLAAHASGRNAAIYRPLEDDETTASLTRRTWELLGELGDGPLLTRTGVLLVVGQRRDLAALCARARDQGVAAESLDGAALHARAEVLRGGAAAAGLFLPEGGVLDIHGMTTALWRASHEHGVQLRVGRAVVALGTRGERVREVVLDDGERIATGTLVLAAGGFGHELSRRLGVTLPLQPLRRHLVQLAQPALPGAPQPVVWRVDDDPVYVRREGAGLLASPCDETASSPGPGGQAPAADPSALSSLSAKLLRLAPSLQSARVRTSWACLRTFAPDRELVVGADPRLAGLYWITGFGGRGMGVGPATGELLRSVIDGEHHPLARHVAPARLLRGAPSSSARGPAAGEPEEER